MLQSEALEMLKSGKNVFLTGEPGSGKSYTISKFTEWLSERHVRFAVTASTGIAASHLDGNTIHSWSGIGINSNLTDEQVVSMSFKSFLCRKLRETRVLIIDEVSMLDAVFIDDLDKVLRRIVKDLPFGGLQVVFVGDFFQLPPVSKERKAKFAFESESWESADLTVCYLTEQHRQSDSAFLDILSAIRKGEATKEHEEILKATSSKDVELTRLFTHNVDVDRINSLELEKLKGKPSIFKATSWGHEYDVATLKKSCLSPEFLYLKVGAKVMFTKNKINDGYVNGTVGEVVELDGSGIGVRLKNGNVVYPEIAEWNLKDEYGGKKAGYRQYPLRLAWAMTVHKSQGMSLDGAIIDLSGAFEYGQGYVAISRVRTLEGLKVMGLNEKALFVSPLVMEKDREFRGVSY